MKRKNLVFIFFIFTLYRIIYIILYDNNKFFNMCKANIFLLQIFNIYVNINMFLVFKYSYHFKEVYVNGKGM